MIDDYDVWEDSGDMIYYRDYDFLSSEDFDDTLGDDVI